MIDNAYFAVAFPSLGAMAWPVRIASLDGFFPCCPVCFVGDP